MHKAGFTEREMKLLETFEELIESGMRENFINAAAVELKLSPVTIRTRLSRMRSKYNQCKEFMAEYRGWQQRLYQKTGGRFHNL